jgi:hypothetical protein
MTRLILMLAWIVVGAAATVAAPPDFLETFTYPDGSLPPDWVWTGDPQGGGEFAVQDGEFVHLDGGYVYYVRLVPEYPCDQGWYDFDVKDSNWEFAWCIYGTADSGGCYRLYHNAAWGQPGYTLTYSVWSTLPEYPDGLYMFHNCTDWYTWHYWTEPLVGWHHITIQDIHGEIWVTVDDSQVIFHPGGLRVGEYVSLVGLGATADSGVQTPAFDNVEFEAYYCPVDQTSWGRVKSLFR